jgi:outer membrane protein insertion porin family
MHISAIRVEGATTTRSSFLDWLINPHLERHVSRIGEAQEGENVRAVLNTAKRITNALLETDNFASVEPRIEAAKSYLANEGDVELVFATKPKGRYFLKTATEIGDQEGNVVSVLPYTSLW